MSHEVLVVSLEVVQLADYEGFDKSIVAKNCVISIDFLLSTLLVSSVFLKNAQVPISVALVPRKKSIDTKVCYPRDSCPSSGGGFRK